jgi:hypothetical protein
VVVAAVLGLGTLTSIRAWAIEEDGAPSNVYMTGAEVRIDRAVEADLTVAAGRIHVDQPVAGDALLGAGSIDVQAPVGEDLRAAGGIVTVASSVQGTALIAAGRVILTSSADMRGEIWVAAGSVTLGGRAQSAVKVYAREVSLRGEIFGPVTISSDRIEIQPGARVYGDVSYTGANEIVIQPGAHVTGTVTRVPANLETGHTAANVPGLKPLRPLLIAALFAAGVLLHALFPSFTGAAVRTLGAVPARSIGIGTALFFSVPPVAVLLVITIIGIPVGITLIAAYALALLVGYLVVAYFCAGKLAQVLRQRTLGGWMRYALLASALLLLALAISIPYLGALVLVLAAAAGLGAIVLQRFSRPTAAARPGGPDHWPAA